MIPKQFRIWDTLEKRWFWGGTDADSIMTMTDSINIFGEIILMGMIGVDSNTDKSVSLDRISDLIVVQNTGLKDNKERYIYEGDVVKTPKGITSIIYENGCFYAPTSSKYRLGGWEKESITIIGNIYENPDLLK